MNITVHTCLTFAASVLVGCGAAVAIASTAAVGPALPSVRSTAPAAPREVVRLEPIVVTVSKPYFDAVRNERAATEVARSSDVRKSSRG